MADDLAAWLTQIWDEDEKLARAVKPLGEVVVMGGRRHPETFGHSRHTVASEDGYPRTLADPEARAHFALYEPASVLARIAADRQVLADYLDACRSYTIERTPFREGQRFGLLMALARLAEAHADRPGFQEEWRP